VLYSDCVEKKVKIFAHVLKGKVSKQLITTSKAKLINEPYIAICMNDRLQYTEKLLY